MKPRVIAELGQCFEGDLARALEMLDSAKDAGAWGAKIQMLQPERIAAVDAAKYWEHGDDRTQRQVFADNGSLTLTELHEVVSHARSIDLKIGATPFDVEMASWVESLGFDFVKVASGDITNEQLVTTVAGLNVVEMIVSTGAASVFDVTQAREWIGNRRSGAVTWLACSLEYPTPIEHAALGRIRTLERWTKDSGFDPPWPIDEEVGYSDHTLGVETGGLAVAAGATVLEKHVTDTPGYEGVPDHEIALTFYRLGNYVTFAEEAAEAIAITNLGHHAGENAARHGARRHLVAVVDIPKGAGFHTGNVEALRPGPTNRQIPASRYFELLSHGAGRDYRAGEPIDVLDLR